MDLIEIYECLCDQTRVRILNLLRSGPLCVCHIQEILLEPQVKVSRHLNYLKARGAVVVQREANWMIYSLASNASPLLELNLNYIQNYSLTDKLLKRDNAKLAKVRARLAQEESSAAAICCGEND